MEPSTYLFYKLVRTEADATLKPVIVAKRSCKRPSSTKEFRSLNRELEQDRNVSAIGWKLESTYKGLSDLL